MMNSSKLKLLVFLGWCGFSLPGLAQTPAPQKQVTIVVDNVNSQPPQPVKAASVSVMFQDVTDTRGVTNSQGQVLLEVSSGAALQSNLRIEVSGAGDLVIYQPPDGALSALPSTLNVTLLPKGSPALLGPAQIQAMLHRMSLEVTSLQKQNAALQTQVNATQPPKPDLGAAIADWAQSNGFSAAQVDSQVQQWAENIEKQSNPATPEQKALAELALKHYDTAAQLFSQASNDASQNLSAGDAQMQALMAQAKAAQEALQAMRTNQLAVLRQLLDSSEQAAGADDLNLQYHQATQALESAEAKAEAEYKAISDPDFQALWLRAAFDVAGARWDEGQFSAADQSLPLLAQSADGFQKLAGVYASIGNRELAAEAQANYAAALGAEGGRAGGDQSVALLNQAVQAYQNLLSIYTKAAAPQDWAMAENNLSVTLMQEGMRAGSDQATALFDQAIQAVENALQVRTKADMPQDWAQSQMNLGNVLLNEGMRADAAKAVPLLQQAVQAYQSALQVYTKTDDPNEWATTQNNLAFTFTSLGMHAGRDQAMGFLNQAIAADQSALEVRTQANVPQEWAQTQLNLGNTYMTESYLIGGDNAPALLDQAVQAFRNALQVQTRDSLPQAWAATQYVLGNALLMEATSSSGDKAIALLDQAAQAYRDVLQVTTRTELPQQWASTQFSLASALAAEAERTADDKAPALLDQAAQADRAVLQVFTETDMPQQWAAAQLALGFTLMLEGEFAASDEAKPLFDQSSQAFNNALQVFTKSGVPKLWTQAQISFVTLNFVEGNFVQCLQQDALLTDDTVTPYEALARDALKLACEWGAKDKPSALATAKALLAAPFPSPYTLVDLVPAAYSIAQSPAFQPGRDSWLDFFSAVQNHSSSALTAALQKLEPVLQQ